MYIISYTHQRPPEAIAIRANVTSPMHGLCLVNNYQTISHIRVPTYNICVLYILYTPYRIHLFNSIEFFNKCIISFTRCTDHKLYIQSYDFINHVDAMCHSIKIITC